MFTLLSTLLVWYLLYQILFIDKRKPKNYTHLLYITDKKDITGRKIAYHHCHRRNPHTSFEDNKADINDHLSAAGIPTHAFRVRSKHPQIQRAFSKLDQDLRHLTIYSDLNQFIDAYQQAMFVPSHLT